MTADADPEMLASVPAPPIVRFCAVLGAGAFFLGLISYNFIDPDLWHEMTLIRESLRAGHLILSNPFAYTPSRPLVIHHEWGAGALAFFATRHMGDMGVIILKYLAAGLAAFFCMRCSARRGVDVQLFCMSALLAAFLSHLGFYTAVRAQVYTFAFTACLLWLLDRDRSGDRKWMAVWLAVFPLWVNLHAGFVVGIGLLGLYWIEELARRKFRPDLLLVIGCMLAETLLNPYGTAFHSYLARALFMPRPRITEWRPVFDVGPAGTVVFLAAVAVAIYVLASRGVRRMPGIFFLAACAMQAGLHRKMLPLFAVAWLCCVPAALGQTRAGQWLLVEMRRRARIVAAGWILVALWGAGTAIQQRFWDTSMISYPLGAVRYLRDIRFHGNLMAPFRQGAYVSWELYPAVKVSVDGRYEVAYQDTVVEDLFAFYEAEPGWENTLEAYPTDLVLVPRSMPIATRIHKSGWPQVYLDREFAIHARPN